MAVEVFNAASLPQDSFSPAAEYLFAKWKTLKNTGGLTLQRLTEEASYPIAENAIYMIGAGDDFAFMYVGSKVQRRLETDPTGTLLSQGAEAHAPELSLIYKRVFEAATPFVLRYVTTHGGRSILWQRLVLPIQIGSIQVAVCYCEIIGQRDDVFDYLFEISRNPLIVFYPTRDERLRINDGWILVGNAVARTLASAGERIDGHRLREYEIFDDGEFWTSMHKAATAAQPSATARTQRFAFEIVKFGHLLTLRVLNVDAPGPV